MNGRSSFQDSDFIVSREGEVEAEVRFHGVLNVQKKLLVPECLAIIGKARSAAAPGCDEESVGTQARAPVLHAFISDQFFVQR
jgi:hypothetical protein